MTELNIAQTDVSRNISKTVVTTSALAFLLRMGMWGETMFGSNAILGGSLSYTYKAGVRKIKYTGSALNVKKT